MRSKVLVLLVLAALIHSGCWAKIDDRSGGSKKLDKGKVLKNRLQHIEGSADYDDEEDYDYDEDEYEDEGSGSHLYKDDEAQLIPDDEEGNGKGNVFPEFGSNSVKEEKSSNVFSTSDDIHFEDSNGNNNDDGLLYEYYNEEYEPDYDQESSKEKKSKVLYKAESDIVVTATKDERRRNNVEISPPPQISMSAASELSYLYIMLASAFISFALALAVFFLCRGHRSGERRKKQQSPFTVLPAPSGPTPQIGFKSSPIVKSYQRVPTSTREFLLSPPPPPYSAASGPASTTIQMSSSQKPLLEDGENH